MHLVACYLPTNSTNMDCYMRYLQPASGVETT